jgi:hypothetical protein
VVFGADGLKATSVALARFSGCACLLVTMTFCTLYAAVVVGSSGFGVYVETFISAGVLALLLDLMSARQRRALGWVVLALLCLNCVIAIGETLLAARLVPIYIRGELITEPPAEFRGTALYDHPLTGAAVTAMAAYLVLGSTLRLPAKAAALALCIVGLLAFGGRTALLVTLATLTLLGIGAVLREVLQTRSLRARTLAATAAVIIVVPLSLGWLAAETTIGTRIASKLYVDDSAKAREVQWRMLDFLDTGEIAFGTPVSRMDAITTRLNLDASFIGAENFLLVAVINLGIVGSIAYIIGFSSFLVSLWRRSPLIGRVALATTLLIASGSNSFSTKSSLLFILVATLAAMAAFAASSRDSLARTSPPLQPIPPAVPQPSRARGLRPAFVPGLQLR